MTAQTEDRAAVRCSIDVTADPDRAFRVFTEGIDTWWHRDHHV